MSFKKLERLQEYQKIPIKQRCIESCNAMNACFEDLQQETRETHHLYEHLLESSNLLKIAEEQLIASMTDPTINRETAQEDVNKYTIAESDLHEEYTRQSNKQGHIHYAYTQLAETYHANCLAEDEEKKKKDGKEEGGGRWRARTRSKSPNKRSSSRYSRRAHHHRRKSSRKPHFRKKRKQKTCKV